MSTLGTPTAELTVRQLLYFSPEDEEGRLDASNLVDQILIRLSVFIISHKTRIKVINRRMERNARRDSRTRRETKPFFFQYLMSELP